ncbi:MAG TPA: TonB family protein, partial [Longimicrobium sp.]|nr:TonB family protein [Longimicrobium sp.]
AAPGVRSAGTRTLRNMMAITPEMAGNRSLPPLGVVYAARPSELDGFYLVLERQLQNARIDGVVVLRFRVLANGRVDRADVKVVSSTHEVLAGAVTRAIGRLWFHPAQVNGVLPVNAWVTLPVHAHAPDP